MRRNIQDKMQEEKIQENLETIIAIIILFYEETH
jgi:hypothetical protein